jgi:starch synthase
VHEVGGLRDTVLNGINGFSFNGDSLQQQAENLIARLEEVIELEKNQPAKWKEVRSAAAQARFLWSDAAQAYEHQLYRP